MAKAYISKGMTAFYKNMTPADMQTLTALGGLTTTEDKGFALPKIQEIGELGVRSASSTYDKIEVTTLEDDRHVYVNGLMAESETNELTIKFLYDAKYFKFFQTALQLEEAKITSSTDYAAQWTIEVPASETILAGDGTKVGGTFTINGNIASVVLDNVTVNNALTMTITLTVIDIDYATK